MFDRDLALEALSTVLSAPVTSIQKQHHQVQDLEGRGGLSPLLGWPFTNLFSAAFPRQRAQIQVSGAGREDHLTLSITEFIPKVFNSPTISQAPIFSDTKRYIIDEKEFFAPEFNYDFTNLKDTETYHRGEEVYERPCGWFRFGLKVLNKYDGNTWLGTRYRSTQSVPGEWPVSYHGTSDKGAEGIIEGNYKAGSGQVYGRGVYSTPYVAEAVQYAETFTYTGKRYKVILQNRINPEFRQKTKNDKYWLVSVPPGTSAADEQKMVERSIRPYGLLVKEV